MDLDDWEFLPDDGFLNFHHQEDNRKGFDPKDAIDMNCFMCPSPTSRHIVRTSENSGANQLVHVPICLKSTSGKNPDQEIEQELTNVPIVEIDNTPPKDLTTLKDSNLGEGEMVADQDMISLVFFKKVENEFVDMKMNSPKSGFRGIKAQTEAGSIQLEEKEEVTIEQEIVKQNHMDSNINGESNWEGGAGGGLNKWRCGIGALCFIGVAAALTCIFIFGSKRSNKYHHHNQKLQFQIYTDNKKIEQVVQQGTRLNQAISAVREVPLIGAHITCGGHHYDGL